MYFKKMKSCIGLILVFTLVVVRISEAQVVDPSSSTESSSTASTESTTVSSTTPSTTSSTTPSTTSSTTPSTTSSTTPSTTSSTTSTTTTTTTTTPAPPFTCPAAGVYADADCKKYHRCTASLVDYVYTCPGTSYFNEMTMKCSTVLSPKCTAQTSSTTTPAPKKSRRRPSFPHPRFSFGEGKNFFQNRSKFSRDEIKNQWLKKFEGDKEGQKFSKDDLKKNFLGKYQKKEGDEFSKDNLMEKYLSNFSNKKDKKFSKDQLKEFLPLETLG